MGSASLHSPGTQPRDRLLMPGISCMWPMYGREGEWGISYFWYWLNWIARLDVFVLALMLTYVIAVFSRAFYRYHFAPGAQGSDSPRGECREFIGELGIKAGSIKAIASASPYVGLVGTCFGISSVFRGFAMEKHRVQIIETSVAAVSLVPTAAGILVAVPAICFHNYLRMLVYYRGAGINADVALILNLIILLGFLGFSGATLTLPGIAGVILTVGMGVDSNVLIFERIREELRNGKTPPSAVDQGFAHAWVTIVDTHVTTIVSAFILFIFGTGPVKGFAVTLTFGLLANLFTAVFVSRVIFDYVLLRKQRGEALSIG